MIFNARIVAGITILILIMSPHMVLGMVGEVVFILNLLSRGSLRAIL